MVAIPLTNLARRRPTRKPSAADDLPDEVLLLIFNDLVTSNDATTGYVAILNAALVCKQWHRTANDVLLRNIEVIRQDQADQLVRILQKRGNGALVECLSIGTHICGDVILRNVISKDGLLRLLGVTPNLRKLTILHTDYYMTTHLPMLTQLESLEHLTEVTIAGAIRSPQSTTPIGLIKRLPRTVKYLHLTDTYVPPTQWELFDTPPAFELTHLTIPEYPTPFSDWVLSRTQALDSLTVTRLTNTPVLAERFPRLHSLVVFGAVTECPGGLGALEHLDSLDLLGNADSIWRGVVESLPESFTRFTFRSQQIAEDLPDQLYHCSRLRCVRWNLRKQGLHTWEEARANLELACATRGAEYEVIGPDGARAETGVSFTGSTLGPTIIPTRILSYLGATAASMLNPALARVSDFTASNDEAQSALWDYCFQGRTEFFLALKENKAQQGAEFRRQKRLDPRRRHKMWLIGALILLPIDLVTMAALIAVFHNNVVVIVPVAILLGTIALVSAKVALNNYQALEFRRMLDG